MEHLLGGMLKMPVSPGEFANAFDTGARAYNTMATGIIDREFLPQEKALALAQGQTRLRADNFNLTMQQGNWVRDTLIGVPRLAKDVNDTYNDVCVKKIERRFLPQMLDVQMANRATATRLSRIHELREALALQHDIYRAFGPRYHPCCGRPMGYSVRPVRKYYYHPNVGVCYQDVMPSRQTLMSLPCGECKERIRRSIQQQNSGNGNQRGGGGGGGGNQGGGNQNNSSNGNNQQRGGGGSGGNQGGGGNNNGNSGKKACSNSSQNGNNKQNGNGGGGSNKKGGGNATDGGAGQGSQQVPKQSSPAPPQQPKQSSPKAPAAKVEKADPKPRQEQSGSPPVMMTISISAEENRDFEQWKDHQREFKKS